jgi:hypothetical protein
LAPALLAGLVRPGAKRADRVRSRRDRGASCRSNVASPTKPREVRRCPNTMS